MTPRRLTQSPLLALVMVGVASMASARSITVAKTGGPLPAAPSDIVTVSVTVDTEGDIVSALGMHIAFTPGLSLVGATSVAPPAGIYWQPLPGDGTVDGIGYWYVKYDAVDPPAGGGAFNAVLATLQFHVTPGASGLQVVSPVLDPGLDGFTTWDAVNGYHTEFGYTLNSTDMVPEPGSALLLGLTVVGIGWAGRRRRVAREFE